MMMMPDPVSDLLLEEERSADSGLAMLLRLLAAVRTIHTVQKTHKQRTKEPLFLVRYN